MVDDTTKEARSRRHGHMHAGAAEVAERMVVVDIIAPRKMSDVTSVQVAIRMS